MDFKSENKKIQKLIDEIDENETTTEKIEIYLWNLINFIVTNSIRRDVRSEVFYKKIKRLVTAIKDSSYYTRDLRKLHVYMLYFVIAGEYSDLLEILINAKNATPVSAGVVARDLRGFIKDHMKNVPDEMVKDLRDEIVRLDSMHEMQPEVLERATRASNMRVRTYERLVDLKLFSSNRRLVFGMLNERIVRLRHPRHYYRHQLIYQVKTPIVYQNTVIRRIFEQFLGPQIRSYGYGVNVDGQLYGNSWYPLKTDPETVAADGVISNMKRIDLRNFDDKALNLLVAALDSIQLNAERTSLQVHGVPIHKSGYRINTRYLRQFGIIMTTPREFMEFGYEVYRALVHMLTIRKNPRDYIGNVMRIGIRIVYLIKQDPLDGRMDNFMLGSYDSYEHLLVSFHERHIILYDFEFTGTTLPDGTKTRGVRENVHHLEITMGENYTMDDVTVVLAESIYIPNVDSKSVTSILAANLYSIRYYAEYNRSMQDSVSWGTAFALDSPIQTLEFSSSKTNLILNGKKLSCGPTAIILTVRFGKYSDLVCEVTKQDLIDIFGENYMDVIFEQMDMKRLDEICKKMDIGCYIVDRNFECIICTPRHSKMHPLVAGWSGNHLYLIIDNDKRKYAISRCVATYGEIGSKSIHIIKVKSSDTARVVHSADIYRINDEIHRNEKTFIDTPLDLNVIMTGIICPVKFGYNRSKLSDDCGKINELQVGNVLIRNNYKYSDGAAEFCEKIGIWEEPTLPGAMMKCYLKFIESTGETVTENYYTKKKKILKTRTRVIRKERPRSVITEEDRMISIDNQSARVYYNENQESIKELTSKIKCKYGDMPYSGIDRPIQINNIIQSTLDGNKEYTSIAISKTVVPVFDGSDNFVFKGFNEKYNMATDELKIVGDNRNFKPGKYHLVYCENEFIGAGNHYSFVLDELVKQGIRFTVDCYKIGRSRTTVYDLIGDFVEFIIKSIDDKKLRKNAINQFIGCMAKDMITTTKFMTINASDKEMIESRNDYVITVPELGIDKEVAVVKRTYRLADTQKILYETIIDFSILRMFYRMLDMKNLENNIVTVRDPISFKVIKEIKTDIKTDKISIDGCATDSLFFTTTERMKNMLNLYCEHNDHEIGGSKIVDANPPTKCRKLRTSVNPFVIEQNVVIKYDKKLNMDKMHTVLDGKSCMLIGGAGNGKTTAIKEFIKHNNNTKRVIVATPTNKASTHFEDAVTIHGLLESHGFDVPGYLSINVKKEIDETDIIVIDECTQITGPMLGAFEMIKNYKPEIEFILSFDPDQLRAPHMDYDIVNCYTFRKIGGFRVISMLYNYRQELDPSFVKTLDMIRKNDYSFIKISDDRSLCLRNLAHTNKTCNLINTEVYEKVFNKQIQNGYRLVSCGNFKMPDGKRIPKNGDYTVKSVQRQCISGHYIELVGLDLIDSNGKELHIDKALIVNDTKYSSNNKSMIILLLNLIMDSVHQFIKPREAHTRKMYIFMIRI
jgi:hypothetical protein